MTHTSTAADHAHGRPAVGLFGEAICAKQIRTNPTNVRDQVKARLATGHAALVKHFPTDDPNFYAGFLAQLGEPLDNYGAGSDAAAYRLHEKINVVRCRPGGARVQEQGGPLAAHSGRAFAKRRPAYTVMLMTHDGWPGTPGLAGESTAVRWADAIARHRELFPAAAEHDLALLTGTPVHITAQYVDSELSDLPLLYPLPDSTGEDDLGARFSLVIHDQLPGMGLGEQLTTDYLAALERFSEAANDPGTRYVHPLQQGQMIILDNNRFGHGRLPMPTSGPDGQANPRELWSATVA